MSQNARYICFLFVCVFVWFSRCRSKGPVDFSNIENNAQISLDKSVYCDTNVYCSHIGTSYQCILTESRNSTYCVGPTQCGATCGACTAYECTVNTSTVNETSAPPGTATTATAITSIGPTSTTTTFETTPNENSKTVVVSTNVGTVIDNTVASTNNDATLDTNYTYTTSRSRPQQTGSNSKNSNSFMSQLLNTSSMTFIIAVSIASGLLLLLFIFCTIQGVRVTNEKYGNKDQGSSDVSQGHSGFSGRISRMRPQSKHVITPGDGQTHFQGQTPGLRDANGENNINHSGEQGSISLTMSDNLPNINANTQHQRGLPSPNASVPNTNISMMLVSHVSSTDALPTGNMSTNFAVDDPESSSEGDTNGATGNTDYID